jgi:putative transcriptional regulator
MKDKSASGGKSYPENLSGQFLISETELIDPNFFRTVVLIIHHNEEGAFGLTVTRKTTSSIGELIPLLEKTPASDIPVYSGGPVQQEYLFILHSAMFSGNIGEHAHEAFPGVIFEPATEEILEYLKDEWPKIPIEDRPSFHFYAGYSGWTGGQLESELDAGAWIVNSASSDIIFHPDPAKGWEEAMSKKGPFYRIIAETGFKPSMN